MKHPAGKIITLESALAWRAALRRDGRRLAVARCDYRTGLDAIDELYALARMGDALVVLIPCDPDNFGLNLAAFSCVSVVIDTDTDHSSVRAACSALQPEFYQDLRRGLRNAGTDPFVPDSAIRNPQSEIYQNGAPATGETQTAPFHAAAGGEQARGSSLDLASGGAPILVQNAGGEFAAPRTPGDCRMAGTHGAIAAGADAPPANAPLAQVNVPVAPREGVRGNAERRVPEEVSA